MSRVNARQTSRILGSR